MKAEEVQARELEALYQEKRDKLSSRLPLWSLLVALFSLFGYAGLQPGLAGYVVLLFPPLAACVARFASHSERILDRLKRRIYQIEEEAGYRGGYEHQNADPSHGSGSGEHIKALRDFIVLTDGFAIIMVMTRFFLDHLPALAILAALMEGAAIVVTCFWMQDAPAHLAAMLPNSEREAPRKTGAATHQAERKRSLPLLRNGTIPVQRNRRPERRGERNE